MPGSRRLVVALGKRHATRGDLTIGMFDGRPFRQGTVDVGSALNALLGEKADDWRHHWEKQRLKNFGALVKHEAAYSRAALLVFALFLLFWPFASGFCSEVVGTHLNGGSS